MLNVYWYPVIGLVLFFILSPGILVTLPPKKDCGMWMQTINGNGGCATSLVAVAVHALVFVVLFGAFVFFAQHKL